jgi:serine/threonine protein kinase
MLSSMRHIFTLRGIMQKQLLGGRYKILGHLHRVGETDYYSAIDIHGNQSVTVRTIDASEIGAVGAGLEHLAADKLRRKIENEAELFDRLQVPGVLPLVDYGFDEPISFYVYPAFDFDSLQLMIERDGRLPVTDAIAYIGQAAATLSALHERGIVHCDISAETLLVIDRQVNVIEFTIASHDTIDGVAPGNPPYMSPEAIRGAEPSPARDIWALGVTLYYSLAGELPFGGIEGPRPEGVPKLFQRIVSEAPPPFSERHPHVPVKLAALIDAMLAKDPAARPSSMAEVVARLGEI